MQQISCSECGTKFNCGSTDTHPCWCTSLPNMRVKFDLASTCLCPNCLTAGKAKAITRQRKVRKIQRDKERDTLRR